MSSMMLALSGVKLYCPNSFPLLQIFLAADKKPSGLCCYLWCYWLIMIVQFIEQGQVVIPTAGSMIKGRRPFYWIL